jgi:hypothetical protein
MASHAETIPLQGSHALAPMYETSPCKSLTIFFFQLKKEKSILGAVTVL